MADPQEGVAVHAKEAKLLSSCPLKEPMSIQLASEQAVALERWRSALIRWGWRFGKKLPDQSDLLEITSVPQIFDKRLGLHDLQVSRSHI